MERWHLGQHVEMCGSVQTEVRVRIRDAGEGRSLRFLSVYALTSRIVFPGSN